MMDDKMPLSRAILWILLSTLFVSGSALMGWLYYLHVRERRLNDDQYRIVALIQSTPQADALKTVYLAELLNLSLDHPVNLYQFNFKSATQTLLRHPLIKKATIQKILPGTLYIDYQMRTPFAYIGDFTNTAMDKEGYLFPFHPFYTPKRLPKLYLGLEKECKWGSCVKDYSVVQFAFDVLCQFENFPQERWDLKQLDVTQAQADSYGQRQIILVLEERNSNKTSSGSKPLIYVRLSSDHYEQDLMNFHTLQTVFDEKKEGTLAKDQALIFDLRIPHLAFIRSSR